MRNLGSCLLFSMIVWLSAKDWLTSSTVQYPYVESLSVSLSVVVSSLAAFLISSSNGWRNFMLAISTLGCLFYLVFLTPDLDPWGMMPTAGLVVCALAFPWPLGLTHLGKSKSFSMGLIRRRCYMGAAFVGLAAFVMWHGASLYVAWLMVTGIIAAGLVLSFLVRSSAKMVVARVVLIAFYAGCVFCYWFMSFRLLFAGSGWSFLGQGLDSGGPLVLNYCANSLFEGGVISAVIRAVVFTWILFGNAHALLAVRSKTREAVELSIGAFIGVVAQVFILPVLAPKLCPDPNSTGSWTFALLLASLCIATRSLNNLGTEHAKSYVRKRVTALVAGLAVGCLLLALCTVPLINQAWSLNRRPLQEDSAGYIPSRDIPLTLRQAATVELSSRQAITTAHDLIRQSCGAEVKVTPTLYTSLGFLSTAHDDSPAFIRAVRASLLSLFINHYVGPRRALELYLNGRDYGASAQGLPSAAAYYFNTPLSQISPSEATFLLSDPAYYSDTPLAGFRSTPPPITQLSDPEDYTYEQVPLPLPASHINNINHDGTVNVSGEVVSTASTTLGVRAFAWKDGKIRVLPDLKRSHGSSFAVADNNRGLVVGWSYGPNGQHAVLWDAHDQITDLGTLPGYQFSLARSVNSKGQVVGYAFSQHSGTAAKLDGPARAFLWQSGKMVDLGTVPGCTSSRAYAINDSGQIAGWLLTNDGATHAMVYENGTMHDIGTLGGKTSLATAINNQGQVVGAAQRYDGTVASFFWQNGAMHDIGSIGDDMRGRAWAINDLGQVVGLSFGQNVNIDGYGGHPYIWDIVHGIRPLAVLMRGDPANTNNIFHSYTVFSINNKGEVLGLNFLPGIRRMFLLKPDPNTQPTIAWDNPVQVASVKQIDTKGVLVHAGHWGGSRSTLTVAVGGESIGFAARTVNGSGISGDLATASGLSIYTGAYLSSTGDPSFDSVLNSFAYGGPNPRIINLRGLIPGHNYEVQLFAIDDRDLVPQDHRPGTRAVRYGDRPDLTGNNSNQFLMRDNASVIGRFTAIGPQVLIYQDQLNPVDHGGNINAYVLRDVTNL